MTVRELIKILEDQDQGATVWADLGNYDSDGPVSRVVAGVVWEATTGHQRYAAPGVAHPDFWCLAGRAVILEGDAPNE